MDNPKHYRGESPCKTCGGYTRYKSTSNCVPCLKTLVKDRRTKLKQNPCKELWEGLL